MKNKITEYQEHLKKSRKNMAALEIAARARHEYILADMYHHSAVTTGQHLEKFNEIFNAKG